ncbi:MAG: hypothetical protein ACI90V_010854 [Bacillariaceae sp.]|jgi:hypothetical protein
MKLEFDVHAMLCDNNFIADADADADADAGAGADADADADEYRGLDSSRDTEAEVEAIIRAFPRSFIEKKRICMG